MGGLSKDPQKRAKQLSNLRPSAKGEVHNPTGRPRTTIGSMVKEFEAAGLSMPSSNEIAKIYFYIASLKEDELKQTLANRDLPMMTRIIAKGVLNKKGLDVLEKIVDRAYGKEQRIDITTNGKDLKPEPLTIRFIANNEDLAKIQQEVPDRKE